MAAEPTSTVEPTSTAVLTGTVEMNGTTELSCAEQSVCAIESNVILEPTLMMKVACSVRPMWLGLVTSAVNPTGWLEVLTSAVVPMRTDTLTGTVNLVCTVEPTSIDTFMANESLHVFLIDNLLSSLLAVAFVFGFAKRDEIFGGGQGTPTTDGSNPPKKDPQ